METKDRIIRESEVKVLLDSGIVGVKFPTTEEELGELIGKACLSLVEAQDAISFSIGKQMGFEIGMEQGEAEGKRKVVERVKSLNACVLVATASGIHYVEIDLVESWQSQKEEWGIK